MILHDILNNNVTTLFGIFQRVLFLFHVFILLLMKGNEMLIKIS